MTSHIMLNTAICINQKISQFKYTNSTNTHLLHTHTHTHTFNGPFSGTTQVSQYQKGKNQSGFY